MIKLILQYLKELMDYNYRRAYWQTVEESKFSVMRISMMIIEENERQNPPTRR